MTNPLTRRSVLFGSGSLIAMAQDFKTVVSAVDHILLGVPHLEDGIKWADKQLGVHAAVGGTHPGAGTRNALLSLGSGHYLEIIAPDPAQPAASDQRRLRELSGPRVITFAVTTNDIDSIAAKARRARIAVSGPHDGSRRLPSGTMLRWQTLSIRNELGAGIIEPVPFFIQWAAGSTHPSSDSPSGCVLESLDFEHPDPVRLNLTFEALGFDANVSSRDEVRIIARVKGPKGRVELS